MRYEVFEDLFLVTCKKCGSIEVDLSVDECDQCGNTINGYCNNCNREYRYHNFRKIEE